MWRLWNKLFGWDYIIWKNSVDHGIARLRKDYSGNVWWYRYKLTSCIDTLEHDSSNIKVWLTCNPSKYMKESNDKE